MLSSPRQRASSNARKVSELERASDPTSRGGSAALGDAGLDQSYDPKAKPPSPPSSKPRHAGFAVSSQMQGPAHDTPLAASVQPWAANEV